MATTYPGWAKAATIITIVVTSWLWTGCIGIALLSSVFLSFKSTCKIKILDKLQIEGTQNPEIRSKPLWLERSKKSLVALGTELSLCFVCLFALYTFWVQHLYFHIASTMSTPPLLPILCPMSSTERLSSACSVIIITTLFLLLPLLIVIANTTTSATPCYCCEHFGFSF